MALNATALKNAIIAQLEADPNFADDLSSLAPAQVKYIEIFCTQLFSHIIANMEIKGVTVADPVSTVETYTAGVGSNGGTLVAGANPVVGSVVKPNQTLSQNNDGTGRVA